MSPNLTTVSKYGDLSLSLFAAAYPPESEFHCAVNEVLSRDPPRKRESGGKEGVKEEENGPREGCHLAAPRARRFLSPKGRERRKMLPPQP